jgi:hypothetical protein
VVRPRDVPAAVVALWIVVTLRPIMRLWEAWERRQMEREAQTWRR